MTTNKDISAINFSSTKILVLGDVMLDQYWYGATSRISPEAPVPIVKINQTDNRPGGAANVAYNLVTLGCKVKLLGLTGQDPAADILLELLDAKNIPHKLTQLEKFSTIVKLRVLSCNQQMIRLDHETDLENAQIEGLNQIYNLYADEISNYQAVILSDYAKGVLFNPQPYIQAASALGIPVIVDPKNKDFSLYKGAQIVKPNLKEFQAVVGKSSTLEQLEEKGRNLMASCGIGSLVITRGASGITVIPADQPAVHMPASGNEVYDVTGAGDTVISVLTAAIASGMDLIKAVNLSSVAAGIVVSKVGTSSVTINELRNAMGNHKDLPQGICDEKTLREIVKLSQARGERVVFVNGCYDLLHFGHIRYLEQARALGDRLIVGVNTDESVKRLKGDDRPMFNTNQRMEVLAALKCVDWVVPFTENTPGRLVESLSPDILAKGDENFKSIDQIPESEGVKHVLQNGGEVHLITRTQDCSSTQMISFIEQN